ncbi:MAG: DUF3794 domain-containing protein [Oscillospiraceae bacterium]|nr:DUF3794 domain-containing protein [Oscillospiraceae bacterium]
MEIQFGKSTLSCLDTPVREVRNSEQTQEIRLPDGMPDIGRVLASWGQPILRGKEWDRDSISFTGGMMVWVLYAPEDGSVERVMETWIPFQMNWELPEDTPEGIIRIRCLPRFVDGRSVSPRKIMVRCGMSAMAEAFTPKSVEVFAPEEVPGDVELLRSTYPVRIPKEAGEKTFLIDEDLTMPDSVPQPEQLMYYRMDPVITDRKVLGNKLVFRGNGNLHLLYRSEEGQLHTWDFELPFSQYAQLEGEYGTDAQSDIALMPTNLEVVLDDESHIRLKAGVVGQYLVTDKQLVDVIEDAYSPSRELGIRTENLELPVVLENRRENIYGEQTLPAQANLAADVSFSPDFPRQRRTENGVELELPGTFQVLYYGEDGILRSGTARWEGRQSLTADSNSQIFAVPMPAQPQAMAGSGQIMAKAEVPMEMTAAARQAIPMVTGLEPGGQRTPDPNRPTLILRRAGEERLWDIAKGSGSTVEAIRRANGLQEEPAPNQMLLIPVS